MPSPALRDTATFHLTPGKRVVTRLFNAKARSRQSPAEFIAVTNSGLRTKGALVRYELNSLVVTMSARVTAFNATYERSSIQSDCLNKLCPLVSPVTTAQLSKPRSPSLATTLQWSRTLKPAPLHGRMCASQR